MLSFCQLCFSGESLDEFYAHPAGDYREPGDGIWTLCHKCAKLQRINRVFPGHENWEEFISALSRVVGLEYSGRSEEIEVDR